jgi:peptide chain release factor 1
MRRRASGGRFSCEIVSDSEGEIILDIKGDGAIKLFEHEAGGHRWQRVPPTEQNGRRHSSTFTVAVLIDGQKQTSFDESEIEFEATVGHGPGGQHRNKTASAIRATHKPTGVTAFIQTERSQQANKRKAVEIIRQRVLSSANGELHTKENVVRKTQIGSGERSDKIRTVQEQNDRVIDHRTNKKCNVATYLKGEIWKLQ